MGRLGLRMMVLLGLLITAVGGTGIFAVFTDTVVTGPNSASTGSRPAAVDVVLAPAALVGGAVDCGGYTHQMVTGIFSVEELQPGDYPDDAEVAYVCIRNEGSGLIDVEAAVTELIDQDFACTGDEAAAGDATCGGDQLGELSAAIASQMERVDCATGALTPVQARSLADWVANPAPVATALAPSAVTCLRFLIWVPAATEEATIQKVQTDLVSWRYAFNATLFAP